MATNKHAQIRYQALDRCFRNPGRKYYMEDLLQECNRAIEEFTGIPESIKTRQLFEDIRFMESEQGWSISLERHKEGRRVHYRYEDLGYSINNQPLNSVEEGQLKQALLVLERFKGLPQFQWLDELSTRLSAGLGLRKHAERVLAFQENPYLTGVEYLSPLLDAILARQVLGITYQGFKQEQANIIPFLPEYLKQYNDRWFVFGWNIDLGLISNLALDRIQTMTNQGMPAYSPPDEIDWEEFFEDVIGVTVPDEEVQQVRLRIAAAAWPYIRTKPLHGSMKIISGSNDVIEVCLQVKVNHELISTILSYGPEVEVVAPQGLRERIGSIASECMAIYQDRSISI